MKCESRNFVFSDCVITENLWDGVDSTLLCCTQDGDNASVTLAAGYPVISAFVIDGDLCDEKFYWSQPSVSDDAALMSLAPSAVENMKAKGEALKKEIAYARDRFNEVISYKRMAASQLRILADDAVKVRQMAGAVEPVGLTREELKTIRDAVHTIYTIATKERFSQEELAYKGFKNFDTYFSHLVHEGVYNPFEREALFELSWSDYDKRSLASYVGKADCGEKYDIVYENPLTGNRSSVIVTRRCHWGCFTEGANLYLQDGSQMSMKALAERFMRGDVPAIATVNEDARVVEYIKPSKVIVHSYAEQPDILSLNYESADGSEGNVTVTPNHPIAVCDSGELQYTEAGNLIKGAILCGAEGSNLVVTDIVPDLLQKGALYDLHIEAGNHNYLINDGGIPLIAHNKIM